MFKVFRNILFCTAVSVIAISLMGASSCNSAFQAGEKAGKGAGSATQTPTPNVTKVAATAYLAAATAYNTALDADNKLCPGPNNTNAQVTACYGAYYKADQAFQQALFAINFPPGMKADVNAMISADSTQANTENSIATSSDPNNDYSDFTALTTASNNTSAAAAIVRHDLGLPPVPVGTSTPSSSPS
jgi:hypothetical protein